MNDAARLFETALDWLRENYDDFLFRREDDVVTVLWGRMVRMAKAENLPLDVDYEQNFTVSFGRLQCDIIVFSAERKPLLCAEVKYEPARSRPDIAKRALKHSRPEHLLPGHGLKGHRCDIERIPHYVEEAGVEVAYAVLVDENSYHYSRMDKRTAPKRYELDRVGSKDPGRVRHRDHGVPLPDPGVGGRKGIRGGEPGLTSRWEAGAGERDKERGSGGAGQVRYC